MDTSWINKIVSHKTNFNKHGPSNYPNFLVVRNKPSSLRFTNIISLDSI